MEEQRKYAILTAATILLARKLQPTLEHETPGLIIEHYQWRAIHQASRILDKIDQRWPTEAGSPAHQESPGRIPG